MRNNRHQTEIATTESADRKSETTDSLRILRISGDVYPEQIGGAALHTHLLSKRQAEMGHQVTLLMPDHGDDSAPRRERRDGYLVRRHRELGRPLGNPISPGMIRSIIDLAREYDVVHAHSHLYFQTTVAAALSRWYDAPFVLTNHGLHSQTAPDWAQRLFLPTVARLTFNAADRVLCYTATDRERLRQYGVSAPVSVINNGVDCELFRPDEDVEEQNEVLFVGRLNRNKGPHRLLEAFAGLHGDFPETGLTIVGTGPLHETLERRSRELGVADSVTFSGRIPNHEMPRIYDRSQVLALPSKNEGFPRSVLESMACETPPVTSDLPQLSDVIDDVGRTVPVSDIDGLERALRELLVDDDYRQALGKRAREIVRDNYSWSRTVEQTTAEYTALLETNR